MQETRFICDRCGKNICEGRIFIKTERAMDAAGSMETTGEYVDLCYPCTQVIFFEEYVNRLSYDDGKALLKRLTKGRKK